MYDIWHWGWIVWTEERNSVSKLAFLIFTKTRKAFIRNLLCEVCNGLMFSVWLQTCSRDLFWIESCWIRWKRVLFDISEYLSFRRSSCMGESESACEDSLVYKMSPWLANTWRRLLYDYSNRIRCSWFVTRVCYVVVLSQIYMWDVKTMTRASSLCNVCNGHWCTHLWCFM